MLQDFVETNLSTRSGTFKIRVYPDTSGKETVVLYTENLNTAEPILVRVHSECMTGDTFGSCHCDCGEQLEKSLQILKKEGGALIYLRQEGRGIGLFEKIKSYQLQSNGYDTFEANVLLGHPPDARSYEMVKKILDDLDITHIKLLTNNPSKVSDVAKLGIKVTERIPLISAPNKYNQKYLETKIKKFNHFTEKAANHYFYQFQIDTSNQLLEIVNFITTKRTDPLLKIYVGIAANHHSLADKSEISRIAAIIEVANKSEHFTPVLHFSFRNSSNILEDVLTIKRIWGNDYRLQLNDLDQMDPFTLGEIFDLFSVDIPLSEENFNLIHDNRFRNLINKYHSSILLDNSKGRGIKASKTALMEKIDNLLSYGLNNIALCGGFGPDELEVYFEIRRYYRFNFSIDAESKLKTNGAIDTTKVKLYLSQLIRFDDPKQEGITQTRKFLEQHRRSEWESANIHGIDFLIHPEVFHPGHFSSSSWFATLISNLVKNETTFCEIGCGSGITSCLAALANPLLQVTATDINLHATENTTLNADRLNLTQRITTLHGDVLDTITPNLRFDSIFWLLPFGFLDPGTQLNLEEFQVFDPGYRSIRKLFETAKNHLTPKGRLLIGFSPNLGHPELLYELAHKHSIHLTKLEQTTILEDTPITFELLEGKII